jgi:excisionase family DNA binding protein
METAIVQEVTEVAPMMPLLVSIKQACSIIGRGQSAIYELIGAGKIRAVKSDGRTLIVVESLHQYAASLPPAKIAPPRHRRPQRMRAESNP